MNHSAAFKQTVRSGLSHSLGARLSVSGRFQLLLIALLLLTWSFTGVHSAAMATPSTDPLAAVIAADEATHHAAMASHHAATASAPGDPSLPHDHCADHCLSVMLPVSIPEVASREVALPPELPSAHWEPWRADLTPPPPKPGSFITLS